MICSYRISHSIMVSLFAVLLTSCSVRSDKQLLRSFSGRVTYNVEVTYKGNDAWEKDYYLNHKFGNRLDYYFDAKGNFKRVYRNAGKFGYDFMLFNHKENRLYAKFNYGDTLYTNSCDEVFVSNKKISSLESDLTILDHKCEAIQFEGVDPINGDSICLKYYYNPDLIYIDSQLYVDYREFSLGEIYGILNSQWLRLEADYGVYKVNFEAIEIKAGDFPKNMTRLDRKWPKKNI